MIVTSGAVMGPVISQRRSSNPGAGETIRQFGSERTASVSGRIALGSGLVADLLTIDELEKRALAVVQKIEDELEAELQGQVEAYLEMTNSNR
jgi:hypothetical protein